MNINPILAGVIVVFLIISFSMAAYSDGKTAIKRHLQQGDTIVIDEQLYRCKVQEI